MSFMSKWIEKTYAINAATFKEAFEKEELPTIGSRYIVAEKTARMVQPNWCKVDIKLRKEQASQWSLIRDQLPPIDRQVLFCCAIDGVFTEVDLGQFDGNSTRSKNAVAMELDGDDWAPCSHWMELPEPPKK